MNTPGTPKEVQTSPDKRHDQRADAGQHRARHDEQMRGAVHEQEAQVAPAVAEARQLRLAAAGVVFDRELGDSQFLLGGPDHHLRGKLHTGRAQIEARQHVGAKRAHPAVGVLHAGAEEQVQQARQDRVADVAVKPRHRARLDVVHAIAHHELRPAFQLGHEVRDLVEVVGEVGVGHHDVATSRRGEARPGRRCRSHGEVLRQRARPPPPQAPPNRPRRRCRPPALRRRCPCAPALPAPCARTPRCSPPRSGRGSQPTRVSIPSARRLRRLSACSSVRCSWSLSVPRPLAAGSAPSRQTPGGPKSGAPASLKQRAFRSQMLADGAEGPVGRANNQSRAGHKSTTCNL